MGIFSKLRGEFVDIIEWLDDSDNTIVYRFERFQNEIKNGAKLTVREGQAAVFINEGKLADVFLPGMYTLTTANLPILATLKGWAYGFNSPFKAEVYFVNTHKFTDQKWGTKNPIILNDPRFGMLEIRAFGTFIYKISKPDVFIKEIVGTDGNFTQEEIAGQLRSLIVSQFTDAVGESGLPIEAFAASNKELSKAIHELMLPDFDGMGIELSGFIIENISMPEEIKKEIFELSRLNTIDISRLAQLKAAKAIEKAAENPGGTAAAGMGMGMGFGMAQQFSQAFGNSNQGQGGGGNQAGRPPVPGNAPWYVAINGQQTGPLSIADLDVMLKQNRINKMNLFWKTGMSEWTPGIDVPELNALFANVPPPLPGK